MHAKIPQCPCTAILGIAAATGSAILGGPTTSVVQRTRRMNMVLGVLRMTRVMLNALPLSRMLWVSLAYILHYKCLRTDTELIFKYRQHYYS